jgi:PhnB protein
MEITLTPYLNFNGQCAEAFRFYEKVLGGKIVFMQTQGDSPMSEQTPPELRNHIIHARLEVGNSVLMASDAPPQMYSRPQGNFVSIGLKSAADGERIFKALAEGGTVVMPFGKTFWSTGFGMAVDRFGTPWMVNCEPETAGV